MLHLNVIFHMMQLCLQGDHILVVVKNVAHMIRDHQNGGLDFFIISPLRHAIEGLENVEEKVGSDLQLQVLELGVPVLQFFFVGCNFHLLDAIHHLIEGGAQVLQLLHLLILLEANVHLALADFLQGCLHLLHWVQVPTLQQEEKQGKKEKHQDGSSQNGNGKDVDFAKAYGRTFSENKIHVAGGGVALHNKVISGKIGLFLVGLKGYLLSHRIQGEGNPLFICEKKEILRGVVRREIGLKRLVQWNKTEGSRCLVAEQPGQIKPLPNLDGLSGLEARVVPTEGQVLGKVLKHVLFPVGDHAVVVGPEHHVVGLGDEQQGADGGL